MKYSCGHKSPPGTPHDLVRAQKRCVPCLARFNTARRVNKPVHQVTSFDMGITAYIPTEADRASEAYDAAYHAITGE